MKWIKFIASDGTRCAVCAVDIIAVAEESGHATITMASIPQSPVQTDWTFDALVSELENIDD